MRKLILCWALSLPVATAATIATINIPELYGVYHPLQIFEAPIAAFNSKTAHLVGPNGSTEIPYQVLYGKIAFPAYTPASTVWRNFPSVARLDATNDWVAFNGGSQPSYDFATNQLVYFQKTGANSCGLTDGTTYFVKRYNYYFVSFLNGMNQGVEFSTTLGGSKVDITGTSCGGTAQLTYTGFLADASTDTFTAPNHQRQNGDPISFVGGGSACPTGITCDGVTVYYVINSAPNTFKVSTAVAGSAADLTTNVTAGLNKLVTNWTWTLVDTGAPTATAANPVAIDLSDSSRIRLTNGLGAGVDILKMTPPRSWSVGGGTLTNCVVSGSPQTIVCTFPGAHGLSDGSKVTINGVGGGFGPTGVFTISSHTSTTITMATAITWMSGDNYHNSAMTIIAADMSLNPVKGIRLSDGTWIAKDTHLYMSNNRGDDPTNGFTSGEIIGSEAYLNVYAALNQAYSVKFLEAGPLKTTVEATYATYRPQYLDGTGTPYPGATAGTGFYKVDITLRANSKSVEIKYAGDMNYAMFLDSYTDWPGTKPTSIGNRTSQSASCGTYGYGGAALNTGVITGATNANPIVITSAGHGFGSDGIWSLTITGVGGNTAANTTATATPIDQDHFSIAVAGNGNYSSGGTWTATSGNFQSRFVNVTKSIGYSGSVVNTESCNSSERQQMGGWGYGSRGGMQQWVYNSAGSSSDPALAIYTGHGSVLINSIQMTMGFHSNVGALSIYAGNLPCTNCSASNKAFAANNVREFDVYTGTIGDLAPVTIEGSQASGMNPSAMSLEQNIIAGINLSHLYGYSLTFSDPVGGWKNAYMPDSSVSALKAAYTTNTPSGITAALDRSAGNSGQPTLAMWANGSSAIDSQILVPLIGTANYFIYSLVWGDGVRDICCEYVQGTYTTGPVQVSLSNALPDSSITSDQKAEAKAFAALFLSLLWDYDFIPPFILGTCICGEGGGTLNQNQQVEASKLRYVSAFPSHPVAAAHLSEVTSALINNLFGAIKADSGACAASTHYCGAELVDSFFAIESDVNLSGASVSNFSRVGPFINFHADILTPPEPRFNYRRKALPIGDAENGEPSGFIGQAATFYNGFDSTLGQKAIADWFCQSSANSLYPYDDFFGSTLTAINTSITDNGCGSLGLKTVNYPGYFTALRHNFNTANEHLITVSNGQFLSDHAHEDKTGMLAGFLWKSPWFADPNSVVYFPHLSGCYFHNCAIDDRDLTHNWYEQINDTEAPGTYGSAAQTETLAFSKSSHSIQTATRSDGTIQTKLVSLLNFNTAKPIVHDVSTFSGNSATNGKSMAWWQYYDGQAVTTPDGSTTAMTANTVCNAPPSVFPSVTAKHTLSAGVAGPWSWTGMIWPQLANGGNGLNMDAYAARSNSSDEYTLGDFRHSCSSYTSQFAAGNTVSIDSFIAIDGSHATVSVTGFQLAKGQTASISGVTGSGSPNVTATVDSVSGTTATMSGFGGLTGLYSGGTIAPNFMEVLSRWTLHSTGGFDVSFLPHLKSDSSQNPPGYSGGMWTEINGSEVTTYSPAQITYTDGTVKNLTSLDSNVHSAFSISLSGGPQELAQTDANHITWTTTGMTPGMRTLSLSALGGTWYANKAVGVNGANFFTLYHPGGDQPTPYTVTFSTTIAPRRTVTLSFANANADAIRVRFGSDTEYVSSAPCSATCSISVLSPTGTQSFSYEYLSGGTVIATSGIGSIVVQ